eukprot:s8128_g1.t1
MVGELVEYWSASGHRWMPAKVERLNLEARACDLDVKPGAPLNRVRKVSGTSEASASLLKAPRPLLGPILAHNVDVPPPPLACGFKAGDQVQYFSETKQRWVETLVLRMFELEGNICYDLDCKKGVSADKVRSSPRASQERYEVGEQVEYWSVSAGRWLPAKVQVVRLDLGRCDLDIKLAAPIGRIRRPIGHATAPKPVSVPAVPAVPAPPEPMPVMPVPSSTPTPPPARRRKPLPQPPAKPEPPVETAVCLSEEEDEVPPMPHDLRKPLPPPPPMPLPLPVQAAQPTQEPTKPSETEAQKQEPEKRDASPSPSPAAKASAAEEPAEEPVRKSPEPEPVRQKSPSQDSSQESEEEEEKPVRQDMEITRTPTPPRHVLQAAQQACQTYRSPVQLQGPDEPTSPADCIRVELDEESEPTERPPKEEDQAPETEPPAAAPAAEQPLKRPREPSEDLDFEAPPTLPRSVKAAQEQPRLDSLAQPLQKQAKEKGRRRRRKHKDADLGQAEENGSKEVRSDVLPTNGDEGPGPGHSRRRRRRRESDAPSPGPGKPPGDYAPVHEEPRLDDRADHGGRRLSRLEPTPTPGPGREEAQARHDVWTKRDPQRGGRRRIPPGATAKVGPPIQTTAWPEL